MDNDKSSLLISVLVVLAFLTVLVITNASRQSSSTNIAPSPSAFSTPVATSPSPAAGFVSDLDVCLKEAQRVYDEEYSRQFSQLNLLTLEGEVEARNKIGDSGISDEGLEKFIEERKAEQKETERELYSRLKDEKELCLQRYQ